MRKTVAGSHGSSRQVTPSSTTPTGMLRHWSFASDCEGFGLPMVEAMRVWAAGIGERQSRIREIGADYPHYFDPHDPPGLAELIRSLEAFAPGLGTRADARVPRRWLSWKDSARVLLEKTTAANGRGA